MARRKYEVVIQRTELVHYTVEADGPRDAAEKYAMCGDKTLTEVTDVKLFSARPLGVRS